MVSLFLFGFIAGGIILVSYVIESSTGGSYKEIMFPEYYQLQEQKKISKALDNLKADTIKSDK